MGEVESAEVVHSIGTSLGFGGARVMESARIYGKRVESRDPKKKPAPKSKKQAGEKGEITGQEI